MPEAKVQMFPHQGLGTRLQYVLQYETKIYFSSQVLIAFDNYNLLTDSMRCLINNLQLFKVILNFHSISLFSVFNVALQISIYLFSYI